MIKQINPNTGSTTAPVQQQPVAPAPVQQQPATPATTPAK
jgi:hypothetical protein